jgi:hypothetical protein
MTLELIPMKVPVDAKNPNYYIDKVAFNAALKEYKDLCIIAEAKYEQEKAAAEAAFNQEEKQITLADLRSPKKFEYPKFSAPQVSEYVGECILNIARGYAQKHSFRSYSFVNDMISDAYMTCLKYIRSYDPDRLTSGGMPTSALSYFTQASHYAFLSRIAIEKKQTKIKRALVMSADLDTFSLGDDDEAGEFRLNLQEFMMSLGTDDSELDAKIDIFNKSNEANNKPGPLDSFMGGAEEN